MSCKLCAWLCNWLCADTELDRAAFWKEADDWERAHSNEWELWSADSDRNRELNGQASELNESDPDAAFRLRTEAADAGSVWAMEVVGWHYQTGTGVVADVETALEYYRRAIDAGSWMATIEYARLLARQGQHDECREVLEDGVQSDFVPAFFWLAWLRYKHSKSRKTAREIAPLLEYASSKGHPAAHALLCRLFLSGKLGLRKIPHGFRMIWAFVGSRLEAQNTENEAANPVNAAKPVDTLTVDGHFGNSRETIPN